MAKTKYTLPLIVDQAVKTDGTARRGLTPCIKDADGEIVCRFFSESADGRYTPDRNARGKAERIASAVNLHAEMLDLLRRVRGYVGLIPISAAISDVTILMTIHEIDDLLLRAA